ncbi:MAG TPA: zf-HC2 domain-containing protein [Pirellulales bacterium]|nr:zf-HC2 domain-containing protein [Pirellulales bacterium]
MKKETNQSDEWQPCPPGLLGRTVRLPKRRRRHEAVNRALAVGLTLLLVAWGGVYMSSRVHENREFHFGGISCREVHKFMPDYIAHALPPDIEKRVGQHLARCPDCGVLMKQMQQGAPAATSSIPHPIGGVIDGRSISMAPDMPVREQTALAALVVNLRGN